ncbi:ATP-binding cassette domain-containing protein [Prauserella cavernicola]|uniref:ABC transporter ATP-binding protein n=1 Tax=Prauserella cavernicola TaxID=2800127 RepID=A0A934V728_9PSEU|nr:ABC transporter ATP-binding protein [Prauserella cavernicola]MBK1787284.1 ABC transporter ATP-binding protein [Prauserella cavernicola]
MTERTETEPAVLAHEETAELLDVQRLVVSSAATGRRVVDGIDLRIGRGETVALVGESGSGKSMTARAITGLLPNGLVAGGSVHFAGHELLAAGDRNMRRVRGNGIGLLMQDPFTMLNPLTTAGTHIAETLRSHRSRGDRPVRGDLTGEVADRLAEVGITQPGAARKYPFELSGGMRQRVSLAAAIANDPALLIADEPTTALDSTTQREVLRLIRRIQLDRAMGLLLITHDLRVAFSLCDRILVMRAGNIVDAADPVTLRAAPTSDYTRHLLAADLPVDHQRPDLSVDAPGADADAVPLLEVTGLTKRFGTRRQLRGPDGGSLALDGVGLRLSEGRSVGIVGESGSGKTTLARCVLGLEQATSGTIVVDGIDVTDYRTLSKTDRHRARRLVQCVFQDPYSSLNPSHTLRFILTEAIRQRRDNGTDGTDGTDGDNEDDDAEVARLLADVGLPENYARRRPVALSGGQRQRVAIARALAQRPRVLVCDEPVAALDVSVQEQVLRVLRDQRARGVSLLFITHDLAVARHMTDELVVLHRGRVVESGDTADVLDRPRHDYTARLLAAVPTGEPAWLA